MGDIITCKCGYIDDCEGVCPDCKAELKHPPIEKPKKIKKKKEK